MNTQKQTSPLAIVSLVAGILGWTLLPFLGSVGAIIAGHMARREIRRSPGTLDGDGLAIVGLALGWSSVFFWAVGVLIAILFFGGIAALLAWLGLSGQLG